MNVEARVNEARGEAFEFALLDSKDAVFGLKRTLLTAVSLDGVLPSFLVNGGLNRPVFEYYLEHMLLPSLTSGQVLDNYVVHKGDSVAQLAAQRGVELRHGLHPLRWTRDCLS